MFLMPFCPPYSFEIRKKIELQILKTQLFYEQICIFVVSKPKSQKSSTMLKKSQIRIPVLAIQILNGACTKSPRSLTAPVSKTILHYLGPCYK